MKLKVDVLLDIVGQGVAISFLSTFIGQVAQVFSLEFDAVHLVPASECLYLLHPLLFWQRVLSVLVR